MARFLAGALVTLIVLPLIEHLWHRLVMHHECPFARGMYRRHAIEHHKLGRLDVNLDLPPWYLLLLTSPALVALGFLGAPLSSIAGIATTLFAYGLVWTGVHRAIHGAGGEWATHLPFYPALRRHHLAHHDRPTRNFGAVFGPAVDALLGTRRKP